MGNPGTHNEKSRTKKEKAELIFGITGKYNGEHRNK